MNTVYKLELLEGPGGETGGDQAHGGHDHGGKVGINLEVGEQGGRKDSKERKPISVG